MNRFHRFKHLLSGAAASDEALRQQTLRLQVAPVLVRDAEDTILYWNRGTELMYGFTPEEALGHTSQRLLRTTFAEPPGRILERVRSGRTWQGELSRVRRDGTALFVLSQWVPQRTAQGRLEAIVEINTDITDLKRAELAQARLAAIVESSEDAILSKTLDGTISSWNASAERMFGYTAAEAIGRPMSLIIPLELQPEETGILERLRRGEQIAQHQTVRLAKGGRRLAVALTISPVRESTGLVIGASSVLRDLAQLRRIALEEVAREAADPLDSLRQTAQLALEQCRQAQRPDTRALLEQVLAAAKKLDELVRA